MRRPLPSTAVRGDLFRDCFPGRAAASQQPPARQSTGREQRERETGCGLAVLPGIARPPDLASQAGSPAGPGTGPGTLFSPSRADSWAGRSLELGSRLEGTQEDSPYSEGPRSQLACRVPLFQAQPRRSILLQTAPRFQPSLPVKIGAP